MTHRFFTAGFSVTLIAFLLMLGHQSDDGRLMGRYSLSYGAQLAVMLVMLALWAFAWGLARLNRLPDLRGWLPRSGGVVAGLIGLMTIGLTAYLVLLPGAWQQSAIALFRAYSGVMLAGVGFMLIINRRDDHLPARTTWALIMLALAVTAGLTVIYLGQVPASLTFDEAWLVDWGRSMVITGEPVTVMYPQHDAARVAALSLMPYPLLGAWVETFGVSLESARLFYLMIAWAGVPFIAWIANRFYGRTAAISAAVVALMIPIAHNYVRADPLVSTALAISGYFLISGYDRGAVWRYVAAGFFCALMVEGHMLGVRFVVAGGALLTLYALWRNQRVTWVMWGAFVLGGVIFGGVYLFYHSALWGVPLADAVTTLAGGYQSETTLTDDTSKGGIAALWLSEYVVRHTAELGLFVVGLIAAALRWRPVDRVILAFFGLSLIVLIVLLPKYNFYYYIHHLPIMAVLTGALIAQLAGRDTLTVGGVALTLFTGALIVGHVITLGTLTQTADEMIANGYEANAILSPDVQTIAGSQPYYYGLSDRTFYGVEALVALPPDDWSATWGVAPPQALILTRNLDDVIPAVQAMINENDMILTACLPLNLYGRQTRIYVLPEFGQPAVDCD